MIDIEQFYKTNKLDESFDELKYLKANPEVEGFYQPYCNLMGISDKHRLFFHWSMYGSHPIHHVQQAKTDDAAQAKVIYLQPMQGLGNRLLQIDSAVAFAMEFYFQEIKICWSASKGFSDEKFEDMFDIFTLASMTPKITLINYEEFLYGRQEFIRLDEHFHQDDDLNYVFNTDKSYLLSEIKSKSFSLSSFASLDWIFGINLRHRNEYLQNRLALKEEVLTKINSYNIDQDFVGLHIRAGDALTSPWSEHYKKSKQEHYETIASNYNKVFLSTDNKEQEDYFKNKYPNKIFCTNKRFVDSNLQESDQKDYQLEALIDMVLLSKTKKIFGTNWSTFNQVASIIGSTERIQICDKSMANYESKKLTKSYTAITAIKNRFKILKASIHSWLLHDEIKEIVVVDYDSEDFDEDYLKNLDPRIKVIRVKNKKYFHLSDAFNTALSHATFDNIIKLDVDYVLNPYCTFEDFNMHNLDNCFITGNWKDKVLDNSFGFIEYLNGFLICKKKHLDEIGGYQGNENGYGWDDSDLHRRLGDELNLGHAHITLNGKNCPIFHIPHGDYVRSENYKNKDIQKSLQDNKKEAQEKEFLNKYYISLSTEMPKKSRTAYNLIINLHSPKLDVRKSELLYCLHSNLLNPEISHIHVLTENTDNWREFNDLVKTHSKYFTIIPTKDRPSFKEIFDYCHKNIKGNCIVSNADIVVNSSLSRIKIGSNTFLCVTRHEGSSPLMINENSNKVNIFSCDSWIFKSPMRYTLSDLPDDLCIGNMYSDSILNFYLRKSKYLCYNPCLDLFLSHKHETSVSTSLAMSDKEKYDLAMIWCERTGSDIERWDFATGLEACFTKNTKDKTYANKFYSWPEYAKE